MQGAQSQAGEGDVKDSRAPELIVMGIPKAARSPVERSNALVWCTHVRGRGPREGL